MFIMVEVNQLLLAPDVGTRTKSSSIDEGSLQSSKDDQGPGSSSVEINAMSRPKSSDEKDVSSSGSSHCAPGDELDVGDRSEGFKVPVVQWNQTRNRSQSTQYGQEESQNHEAGQDRSYRLPHFQVCCLSLSIGPGRSYNPPIKSHEDEDSSASHAVNLKSMDADNESTDVEKETEADDVTDTRNGRDTKADTSSNSTRGLNKMDGKCSSSEDDPRKTDRKSSKTKELKPPREPSGTRSPIISKDQIVARGKGVVDSEVLVLNGVNDDAGVCANTELVFPPARSHKVYFRRSPLDVRHKSPCAAIQDQT